MAVHCGTCGTRLADATENGGSFPVDGWDFGGLVRVDDHYGHVFYDPVDPPDAGTAHRVGTEITLSALREAVRDNRCRIEDTCAKCAASLRAAITSRAVAIARENESSLFEIRKERQEFKAKLAREEAERVREFKETRK